MRPIDCGVPWRSVTVPRTVPVGLIGADTPSPPHATATAAAERPAPATPLPHTDRNSRRVRRVMTPVSARPFDHNVMPICSTDARALAAADADVGVVVRLGDRQRQLDEPAWAELRGHEVEPIEILHPEPFREE